MAKKQFKLSALAQLFANSLNAHAKAYGFESGTDYDQIEIFNNDVKVRISVGLGHFDFGTEQVPSNNYGQVSVHANFNRMPGGCYSSVYLEGGLEFDYSDATKQNPDVRSWVIHDSTEFKIRGEHFDNIRTKLRDALNAFPQSVVVYDMRHSELGDIECLIEFFQNVRMKVADYCEGDDRPMPTLVLHGLSGDLKDEVAERLGDYISRIMGHSKVPARVMLWVTIDCDLLANEKKLLTYFDNTEGEQTCCGEVY